MDKEKKANSGIDCLAEATDDVDKRLEIVESLRVQEKKNAELAALNAQLRKELAESRQREIALRESEKKCRHLIDNSPIGYIIADLSGNIQFVNQRIKEALGLDGEEMTGKNAFDLGIVTDETRHLLLKRLAAKLAGAPRQMLEFPVIDKNGEHNWVEMKASILMEDDKPVSLHLAFVDVTERKKVVDALRDSEKLYRSVIENINDTFYRADKTGRLIMVSPSAAKLLGYESAAQMIGCDIAETLYYNPEERSHFLREMKEKRFVNDYELLLKRSNGTPVEISVSSHYYCDDQGQILGIEGVLRDITERKQAERTLRESEKKFRALAESTSACIYLIQDNKFIYVNPAFESVIGYSLQELAAISFLNFVHPDFRELVRERAERRLKGEKPPERYETKIITKNGQEKWVEISVTTIEMNGQSTIIGSTFDVTERKHAEEALKNSEQFLRLITDNIQDAIRIVDLKTLQYTYSNPYVEKLFGLQHTDYQAMPMGANLDDESRQRLGQLIHDELAHDQEREPNRSRLIELKEKNIKTGQIVWTENNASFIRDDSGEPKAVLSITRDITERKRAEEERLRLQERLSRAEKMEVLGTLAGGVAHDLNNMLGGLVGYPELILMQLPQDSPLRKSILTIQKSGEKAAAVVQDLLTMARRGVASMETLSLNQVIGEYLKTPEHEKMCLFHPGIGFDLRLADDLLPIRGSAVHLSKTVMNLISNAMEAMTGAGVITVTTHNQYIDRPVQGYDDVKEGDYVILSVADTGQGIPQESIGKIFEPFYTKKIMGRSGTGLGLAVVWGTVKDHSGYIDVQSREGEGTTFTIFFPVCREKQIDVTPDAAQSNYRGEGESILVVDDVPEQREMASAMLASLNYRVTLAQSGEDAVEQAKAQKFDLLLLDMIMNPGLDGLETYRQISAIHPRQRAVIVSGFSETERVSEVQKLGAGVYIKKPYTREKLGKAVRTELVKGEV